ncbi:MAG: alpha/beta fold hydrolase [Acidobacteriota bacterium]|jgi:predicted esterase|nr:alpha/beta fold hydrolase [Acidobacteriota bacterium]NLT32940.1 prolyl oligopeptidase family serine peptidase [Acidobacteriota bacterium]
MKSRALIAISLAALCLGIGITQPRSSSAQPSGQQPAPQAGRKAPPSGRAGFMQMKVDPRVQMRSYLFKETGEKMEYALFISSKVRKEEKAPLIVTLHGLGAGPTIMFGAKALELAEEGGYILVGPMGYNVRGWYGISMKGFGPKPKPEGADGAASKPKPSMFSNPDDPENLNELSEKDVMYVLDLVRGEFNVDERRIYLMGHSMGGAGTLHLGVKYPSIWAALAPIAAAAFTIDPDSMRAIPETPILFIHGDADEVVPVANTQRWVAKARELGLKHEYLEMPGVSHGPIIEGALPAVYAFFAKHSKPAAH